MKLWHVRAMGKKLKLNWEVEAHICDPVPVGVDGHAVNWASAVCGSMGALTPGTFEGWELIRGGGLSCGPAQSHVVVSAHRPHLVGDLQEQEKWPMC